MTTNYNTDRNKNGVNGFGQPFCDTVFTATLGAAADTTVTTPSKSAVGAIATSGSATAAAKNKFYAVVSYPPASKIWMAVNATAAVPAGATFAASTSELLGPLNSCKYVKAGDVLHFICTAGSDISVAFYAVQE